MKIQLGFLFCLLFCWPVASVAAAMSAAPANPPAKPEFSWDTVPLFNHTGRPEGLYTDEQIRFMAKFPIVVIEKHHGVEKETHAVEKHMLEDFERIAAINPSTTLIFYLNALIDWPRYYEASLEFLENPDWALRDKEGGLVLKNGNHPQYDLSNPEVREWWLGMVETAVSSPYTDGIFVDAVVQIERQAEIKREAWGDEKYEGMVEGARELLKDSLEILGPGRHLIFNGLFVNDDWWNHSGLAWQDYSTGMMVEFFTRTDKRTGRIDPERLAREIESIGELAEAGHIVLVKGWPRDLDFQDPETKAISREERLSIFREQVTFPLAAFLMAVDEGVYFGYSWGWGSDSGWMEWLPEYDQPLGPPKGPATRTGNVWEREFEHASVWMDADAMEARIDWAEDFSGDLFVAPDGDDSATGLSVDDPFRTLGRAKEEVRKLKRDQKEIVVLLRGGDYRFSGTEVFSLADGAPEGGSIRYRAYPGEVPRFLGSAPVSGWERLPEDYPGLTPEAAGKVWVASIPPEFRNFRTLYQDGRRLPRARGEAFDPVRELEGKTGSRTDVLEFPAGAVGDYRNPTQAELFAKTSAAWAFSILPVRSIDLQRGILTTEPGNYTLGKVQGYTSGDPSDRGMWIENVLEELTEPGEWVFDPEGRRLYLWPEDGLPSDGVAAPAVAELILLEGEIDEEGPVDLPVTGIHFEGIEFSECDREPDPADRQAAGLQHGWDSFDHPNAMVRMRGAADCSVVNCHFRQSGGGGLRLDLTATGIRVENNLFEYLGGTGILLAGYGVGTKDVNRDNIIRNNHIHRIGELKRDAIAIWAYQSGHNLIARNLVHDVPYTAISISTRSNPQTPGGEGGAFKRIHEIEAEEGVQGMYGVWNQLEKYWHNRNNTVVQNEIFAAMQFMADGNAIYVSGAGRENQIRSNYIHHSPSAGMHAAIRCDDVQHETVIADNVIYKTFGHGSAVNSKGRNDIFNNFVIKLGLTAYHTGIFEFASYLPHGSHFRHNVTVVDDPALMPVSLGRTRPFAGSKRITFEDIVAEENLYRCLNDPDWAERYLAGARREGGERGSLPTAPDMEVTDDKHLLIADPSPLEELGIRIPDPREMGLQLEAFPDRLRDDSRRIRALSLQAAAQEVIAIEERAEEAFAFDDSFEHYAGVGLPAYYEFGSGGDTDVGVVETGEAFDGSHVLQFVDGPDAEHPWMPALFIRPPSPQGGVRTLSLHFRMVEGSPAFRVEHRYGVGSGFQTLASFKVDASGVSINSRRVADTPEPGEWMVLKMTLDHDGQKVLASWGPANSHHRVTVEEPFVDTGASFTGSMILYAPGGSSGVWQVDQMRYAEGE